MNLYIFLVLIFPFLSLIISLFFNRNKTGYDLYFNLSLCYMLINEFVSYVVGYHTNLSQIPFANLYILVFPLMVFLLFYKISNSIAGKKRIKLLSVILIIYFIFDNLITKNFFSDLQYHTYLVSTVILIYIVAINLLQIMESDIIHDYLRSKSFWISLGLLLFYVPFLPVIIAFKFMILNHEIREIVNLLLIFAMNSCFIIASLWTKHR
jgi:hypothetical protein